MGKRKNYPANLLDRVHLNELCGSNIDYGNLTEDQLKGVEYILSRLTERERVVLKLYYHEGMSRKAIAEEHALCEERIRQITEKALKKLSVKEWLSFVTYGYESNLSRLEKLIGSEEELFCLTIGIAEKDHIYYQDIEALKLPVKVYGPLKRANIQTVRELLIFTCSSRHIRNLGDVSMALLRAILEKEHLFLPGCDWSSCDQSLPRQELELQVFQKLNNTLLQNALFLKT